MDPNLFAQLYPRSMSAAQVALGHDNKHLFAPPKTWNSSTRRGRVTDVTDSDEERLELHFDNKRRPFKDAAQGWIFGASARTADVALGEMAGISRRHFAIAVTSNHRVYLHQLSAHSQTCVRFSYKTGGVRDVLLQEGDSVFLCLAPWEQTSWYHVELVVASSVQFGIVFPNHTANRASRDYKNHLDRLARTTSSGTATPLPSPRPMASSTGVARRHGTPTQPPMYLFHQPIKKGGYGAVDMFMDLETADTVARKMPLSASGAQDLRNEAAIMGQITHPNIMQLYRADLDDHDNPMMFMPYFPLGHIGSHRNLRPDQYVSAFRQILIALDHLHAHNVAHLDLKPGNVLVRTLEPMDIVLIDFGLSEQLRPGRPLVSVCGTSPYYAPEMMVCLTDKTVGYGVSADVWAAGILMLVWLGRLPFQDGLSNPRRSDWMDIWLQRIAEMFQRWHRDSPGDPVFHLLKRILVADPRVRLRAAECLLEGCALGLFQREPGGEFIDAVPGRARRTRR